MIQDNDKYNADKEVLIEYTIDLINNLKGE